NRSRKRVDDLPVPRDLVAGDSPTARRRETLGRRDQPVAQLDPGHGLLAVARIRDTDHLDLTDLWQAVEELLDLAGIDVLAAADDHVLDPPDDAQVSVAVHYCGITRTHPPRQGN